MAKGNIGASRWALYPAYLIQDFATGKISAGAYALYGIVRLYWGGYDSVFPHQELIASRSGFSVSQVKRLLKELKDTGWILSERQSNVHGSNEYWICDEPFKKPTEVVSD